MSVRVRVDSSRLESLVSEVAVKQGLVFGEWQRQGSVEAERVLPANTPVRTGFLRDSIVKQLTPSGFTVYPTASYASAVEHGTAPHTIFPAHAKVICFRTGNLGWAFGEGAIFAKRVEHPGFAGRFFIRKGNSSKCLVFVFCVTVDSALARGIDLEHKERLSLSHKQGLEEPTYSDTLQMLLKKSVIRFKYVQ